MDKGLIVHAIIYNENKEVLILQRSAQNDVLPEYWDIPGGTLEDGEDPQVGVARETAEEAGITIDKPQLFFYTSNVDQAKNKQFVRLIFIARYQDGEIKVNPGEHDNYAWININNTADYKLVDYLPNCFDLLNSKEHPLLSY